MRLNLIQRHLEKFYYLKEFPPIEQFLISTRELEKNYPHLTVKPQVVMKQEDQDLLLGVHIGDKILKTLQTHGLRGISLQDFLSTIEEISHFVYLAHSASIDKQVSLLDIEVQGEIDKYILAKNLHPTDHELFTKLFERISYESTLTADEKSRYAEANRLGAKMVRWMTRHCEEGRFTQAMMTFMRDFYRMNSPGRLNKVEKIFGM